MEKFESVKNTQEDREKLLQEAYDEIMSPVKYAEKFGKKFHPVPYIYPVHGEDKELLFFGAPHRRKLSDPMFAELKEELEKAKPDIIFVEGAPILNDPTKKEMLREEALKMSWEEVVARRGESGFAAKYAFENNIEVRSPEPSRKEQIEKLLSKGYSREHIFAKFHYMDIPQWHREREALIEQGQEPLPLREYVEGFIERFKEETGWEDFDYSWENLEKIGKEVWGDDHVNETDPDCYRKRIDPIPWEGNKETWTVINEVSGADNFRDEFLIKSLFEDTHKRPFVVFGASHAVMLKSALRKALKEDPEIMKNEEFRESLTEIIESHQNEWWKPKEFEESVRSLLPESLEILASPPEHEQNYNCFVCAFGLEKDSEFLGGNNPVQQEFVKDLIAQGKLTLSDQPKKGDLVFYRNSKTGEISHGGIMESKDTVVSKWMWGPTIAHKLWDVQSSFGDEVLYFKPVAAAEIKKLYEAYKATGVEIKPIE